MGNSVPNSVCHTLLNQIRLPCSLSSLRPHLYSTSFLLLATGASFIMAVKAKARLDLFFLVWRIEYRVFNRTMIVRLISTAQTGYFYTTQRLRQGPKLSAVKYDPRGECFNFRTHGDFRTLTHRILDSEATRAFRGE